MAATWPATGQRIGVRLDACTSPLIAVVDDVRAPEQLHLREPVSSLGGQPPAVPLGTPLALLWTSVAGQHVLPSRLVDRPRTRVPLWRLEPEGEVVVVQRREFVRVPDTLEVELHRGEDAWVGRLADLSEGGARCAVPVADDLHEGDDLHLHLRVDDEELHVPAVVLAVTVGGAGRASARLRFDPARREADLLRRRVLEQQRRARAAGLR